MPCSPTRIWDDPHRRAEGLNGISKPGIFNITRLATAGTRYDFENDPTSSLVLGLCMRAAYNGCCSVTSLGSEL